jgi:hypothetical protein
MVSTYSDSNLKIGVIGVPYKYVKRPMRPMRPMCPIVLKMMIHSKAGLGYKWLAIESNHATATTNNSSKNIIPKIGIGF